MNNEMSSNEKRNSFRDKAISRLGATRINTNGSIMVCEEYNSSTDVLVRFIEHGNYTRCPWHQFDSGKVKSPYDRSVYNTAYIGEGKYSPQVNGEIIPQYTAWTNMLQRCCSQAYKEKHPTYTDVNICDEWENFQTFCLWYNENFYPVEGQRMHIDKDILIRGNKLYSPETCIFVPQCINKLLTKRDSTRGDYPIGVRLHQKSGKYQAQCNNGTGQQVFLGYHNTPELAFAAYKEFKEQHIQKVANDYRDKIPQKLYDALITYEVEITD